MKTTTQLINILLFSTAVYSRLSTKTPISPTRLTRTQSPTVEPDIMVTIPEFLSALYAADEALDMNPLSTGPFSLPPLDYDYNALEPYIDERTLRIHQQQLHRNYVNQLNEALSLYPPSYESTLNELLLFPDRLPSTIQTQVTNNAGGHYNHYLMWKVLNSNQKSRPTGDFLEAINMQYGSFENLRTVLTAAANSVFGSGYAYLVLNPYGRLLIITTDDQTTPIPARTIPLLPIDMWEHAYFLRHQANRSAYIKNYFSVIDWSQVGKRFEAASKALSKKETD